MADYKCPTRDLAPKKVRGPARETTEVGKPAAWNTIIEHNTISSLFRALELLMQKSNAFGTYRNKISSLKQLLFPDEYNQLMCGIDDAETTVKEFLEDVFKEYEFTEMISGQRRRIHTMLDMADAIREMDKRVTDFRRDYDNKIEQVLFSAEKIKAREDQCLATALDQCISPLPCSPVKRGLFSSTKCRYNYQA